MSAVSSRKTAVPIDARHPRVALFRQAFGPKADFAEQKPERSPVTGTRGHCSDSTLTLFPWG